MQPQAKPKYFVQSNNATVHTVCWSGFDIPVKEKHGAEKLVQELNKLDSDLNLQVEAKVKALNEVKELKALNEASEKRIQALQSLAVTDNQHIQRLLDAIEASQSVLAAYCLPGLPVTRKSMQSVLSDLLGILDDGNLVMLCRELRAKEPDDLPRGPINTTPHGKPIPVTANLNLWENADAQITFDGKHWTNVSVEGEFFVALSDGKTSWLRARFPKERVVYSSNADSILKVISANISETKLAGGLNLMRVPSLSKPKTRRALVQAIEILNDSGTPADAKAAKRLKKLLR